MAGIVVGVDGSPEAAQALRWAAGTGRARGWPVTAVLAWTAFDQHHPDGSEHYRAGYDDTAARAALDAYVTGALGADAAGAAGAVARRVVEDHPIAALVECSRDAELVVVGERGLGRLQRLVLASVSRAVLHHAAGPVAIVRDGDRPPARVVVGVDGSAGSRLALAWALDEARARDVPLIVVTVVVDPVTIVPMPATAAVFDDEGAAAAVIAPLLAELDTSGLVAPPASTVVHDQPAAGLLGVAGAEDLLVVGARGHGGFTGLLLGSVSAQVTDHAAGTVVVVRPRDDRSAR